MNIHWFVSNGLFVMDNIKNSWFVLQVLTGRELSVTRHIEKMSLQSVQPYLPRKKMKIRRSGKTKEVTAPLYPGYLFLVGEWNIDDVREILKLPGVVRVLGGLATPGLLSTEDVTLIKIITRDGIAETSKVVREGTKIKVISGPLKELEGVIISVDRRKQRAVVQLPLLNSTVKTSLSFEYIEEK